MNLSFFGGGGGHAVLGRVVRISSDIITVSRLIISYDEIMLISGT